MRLSIVSGNYHVFLLMIKNHQDNRFCLNNISHTSFELNFDVNTKLNQETVISILTKELYYSPYMYLCPAFKVVPYKERIPKGKKSQNLTLSFN